jgi:hypothetical protein
MHLSGDGSLVIADSAAGGYNLSFSAKNWALIDLGHKMVAPYSQHRIAPDRNILVNVRDEKGNGVSRAVNVSDIGTVAVL